MVARLIDLRARFDRATVAAETDRSDDDVSLQRVQELDGRKEENDSKKFLVDERQIIVQR